MKDLRKIKGLHIKRIRNYCGMTQVEFGEALGEWGITSGDGTTGKDAKIIASWESGRRDAPNKVLKAIQDNVLYENHPIRWEYLIGQDEFITIMECVPHSKDEIIAIINQSTEILRNFNPINPIKEEFRRSLVQLLNTRTFSEYNLSQIEDQEHFLDFLEAEIKRSIESYIKYFNQRKYGSNENGNHDQGDQ